MNAATKKPDSIDEEEFKKYLLKPLVKVSKCIPSLSSTLHSFRLIQTRCSHPHIILFSPLLRSVLKYSDMPTEMGNDAVDIATMAIDKFLSTNDYESASALIKNSLDKKFGPSWQCAVGEGFGFDISCQQKYLLHMYYGKVGILCYKS
eukprot:scaffold4193_cov109-Skeletonema_dohrnii-CCMP3373.AAC.2